MKNLFKYFVTATVAVAAMLSCQREKSFSDDVPENAIKISVRACAQDFANDEADLKTYLGTYEGVANTVLWGTGEYMKLAVTSGSSTVFATSTDDSADEFEGDTEAMFEFSVSPTEADSYTYQGLYPASAVVASNNTDPTSYKVKLPEIQNATATAYDPSAYIMVAKPETFTSVEDLWEASFFRATALNKITLKNVPNGVSIRRVKITTPTGKYLAGSRHIDLTADLTAVGRENVMGDIYQGGGRTESIDVKFATPLTGTNVDVWFTSWGVEVEAGQTLVIEAYSTDKKCYTKTITVPSGKTIMFREGYLNTLGANMENITPTDATELEDGDYLILAKNASTYYALKAETENTRIAYENYSGSTSTYSGNANLIWSVSKSGNSYIIENDGLYLGWSSGNTAALNPAGNDWTTVNYLLDIVWNTDHYTISVNSNSGRILAKNTDSRYGFAFYTGSGYADMIFVPATVLETVATPTFSPAAGEVASGTEISISCSTSGATIHYTVDGTDPTSSSATYSSPIAITATTTIKAIAVKEGMANSEVATAQYTIAGVIDYSVIETSNVTLTAGTNGSSATVNEKEAIKVGTSTKGGDLTVTVPAGTTKLHLHAAAWNGVTGLSLDISGANVSPASIALTADSGISGNSPFTLAGNPEDFYFVLELSNITADTDITFTSSIAKRFVVWGVNAESGSIITWNLDSITIDTPPTKTSYYVGDSFDPTGMVVTGHYVDASDNTNTKDEIIADTDYTISPNRVLVLSDDHVTISYQGETASQSITVRQHPTRYYAKVESEPSDWEGQYLIVFETNSVAFDGSLENLDATPNTFEVTIVDDEIESTSSIDAKSFTIASISNGNYSIQASSGKFIGRNSASNGLDSSNSALVNTISWSSGPIIAGSGGKELGFNNDAGQKKFRYLGTYSSIQLYKLVDNTVWDLKSIAVTTPPTKTTYEAGEYFDPTGMVVTATYEDHDGVMSDRTAVIALSNLTLSPGTSTALTTSDASISISYGGKSTSQAITVTAPITWDLKSIAVTTPPTKTTYTAGEYFNPAGLVVTATYENHDNTAQTKQEVVDNADLTFSPSTSTALMTSNTTITITYGTVFTTQAITVNQASTETTVSVTISAYATAHSWSDATQYSSIAIDSNITATAAGGGNTGKYYQNGNNWRFYQNESPTLTITAATGYTISSVKVTYSVSNSGVLKYNSSNVSSGSSVSVNSSSAVFSVGNTGTATNGQVRITQIEVVYR